MAGQARALRHLAFPFDRGLAALTRDGDAATNPLKLAGDFSVGLRDFGRTDDLRLEFTERNGVIYVRQLL